MPLIPVNRREVSLYTVLGLATFMAYFVTCRLMQAPTEVEMPGWVPFVRRPPVPDGWWNWPYAVVAIVDLPVHINWMAE